MNNSHDKIILDISDSLYALKHDTELCLPNEDIKKLVDQVFFCLMNNNTGNIDDILYGNPNSFSINDYIFNPIDKNLIYNGIPDLSTLSKKYSNDDIISDRIIRSSVHKFARSVYNSLRSLGIYQGNILPYYFDRFLGTSIILNKFPY